MEERICRVCGKRLTGKATKCCSEECRIIDARNRSRKISVLKKPKIKRKCKICGKIFIPEYGIKRRVFCSEDCEKANKFIQKHKARTHRNKVKASKKIRNKIILTNKIGSFTYEDLYTRDKGICQICGLPVSKNKRINKNWNGTIDHIIPLSLNGKHSIENCQLTHNVCNALKLQEENDFKVNWIEKAKECYRWKNKLDQYINDMLMSGELKLVDSVLFYCSNTNKNRG